MKVTLWFLSFLIDFDAVTWDDTLVKGLDFLGNEVLQVPFFLMSLMRYITPTLDHLWVLPCSMKYLPHWLTSFLRFMDSLAWVDKTYYQKHKSEDPSTLRATYHAELRLYQPHGDTSHKKSPLDAAVVLFKRVGTKAGISLAIFALSFLPVVGRFVLPAASFYTFNNAVGPVPATVIFGSGLFLPKRYLVMFLQSYFTSRRLMRELVFLYIKRRQWLY